jgi:hypothetical protein
MPGDSDTYKYVTRCGSGLPVQAFPCQIWRYVMYEDTEKFVDMDFEQSVRKAAYHLWEDDGRPFGREKDYWFQALEKLLAERGHPPLAKNGSDLQH